MAAAHHPIAAEPTLGPPTTGRRGVPRRRLMAGALVAALLAFATVTPVGRSAADTVLQSFRSERVSVVEIRGEDAAAVVGLADLGQVSGVAGHAAGEHVDSLALAQERVGFALRSPAADALPPGFALDEVLVLPAREVRFTFDRERAAGFYAARGLPGTELPSRFDGVTLVLGAPAAVLATYRGGDAGMAVVGQSDPVTARVQPAAAHPDVTLDEVRAFLLGLPGLSPELTGQLRAAGDWRRTLPLPVPVDHVRWRATTVDGAPAVALAARGGGLEALVWQDDGRIYGVGGTLTAARAERLASGLAAAP